MKKTELLNSEISAVIADMGHTDTLAIGDCGLPVPDCVDKIDLCVRKGLPGFLDVLDAVLSELCVERVVLAEEIRNASPDMQKAILSRFDGRVRVEYVPHEVFKEMTADAKAVVRTGECTPYANVILGSGVTF